MHLPTAWRRLGDRRRHGPAQLGQVLPGRLQRWVGLGGQCEMLAGRRVFEADSASDSIAKILDGEPDWTQLPRSTPARLQRLLRRCLEKDPRERPQTIAEGRAVIDELMNRLRSTAEDRDARTILISGGVACNAGLRKAARESGFAIEFPSPALSTDNAVMIAAALTCGSAASSSMAGVRSLPPNPLT